MAKRFDRQSVEAAFNVVGLLHTLLTQKSSFEDNYKEDGESVRIRIEEGDTCQTFYIFKEVDEEVILSGQYGLLDTYGEFFQYLVSSGKRNRELKRMGVR